MTEALYSGDDPSGDDPSGDNPSGDDPSGDDPSWDDSSGDDPSGDDPASGAKKMHRLYNPNSYEHFYTTDDNEFANLVSLGWHDELIAWYGV